MIKKIIAYPIVWITYWLGDLSWKLCLKYESTMLYQIYSELMIISSNVQDWADLDSPWKKPE